jgi:protein-S-isoprenylcysteine O-methyltransferase Ste14
MTPRRINPPHYFLVSLVTMLLLSRLPGASMLPGYLPVFGVVPIAAGVALAIWAARLFARVGTNIIPLTPSSALVTDGPFARTRNPMYLGMLLALIGLAVVLDSAWPWLVLPAFYAVIRLRFVRHEERLMEATFGDAYRAYCGRVRRFI